MWAAVHEPRLANAKLVRSAVWLPYLTKGMNGGICSKSQLQASPCPGLVEVGFGTDCQASELKFQARPKDEGPSTRFVLKALCAVGLSDFWGLSMSTQDLP